jgi:AP-2 complex subunit alpha
MIALQLLTEQKWAEKNAGYMAISILLNESHELLRLMIQSIKNDLASGNEAFQCLALACVANVGGQEFAESLSGDLQRMLCAPRNSQPGRAFLKKRCALALLRLFRKHPDTVNTELFAPKMGALLDGEKNIGVQLSLLSLMLGLASYNPSGYEGLLPR